VTRTLHGRKSIEALTDFLPRQNSPLPGTRGNCGLRGTVLIQDLAARKAPRDRVQVEPGTTESEFQLPKRIGLRYMYTIITRQRAGKQLYLAKMHTEVTMIMNQFCTVSERGTAT
jgi:hypothetical protein